VRTSVGDLQFDSVRFASQEVGPGGCLNGVEMTLVSGTTLCSLELRAELVAGRLVPSRVFASFGDCQGYTGDGLAGAIVLANDPAAIPFQVSFQGLSCDGNLIFESYCVAGEFDWHLGGSVDGVNFVDQHLIVSGVICSPQEPMGSCPLP